MIGINVMVSICLGFNVRILVGRQYWHYTVVIVFFSLGAGYCSNQSCACDDQRKSSMCIIGFSSPNVGAGYETTQNQISDD